MKKILFILLAVLLVACSDRGPSLDKLTFVEGKAYYKQAPFTGVVVIQPNHDLWFEGGQLSQMNSYYHNKAVCTIDSDGAHYYDMEGSPISWEVYSKIYPVDSLDTKTLETILQ